MRTSVDSYTACPVEGSGPRQESDSVLANTSYCLLVTIPDPHAYLYYTINNCHTSLSFFTSAPSTHP